MKRILAIILASALVLTMGFVLVGCRGEEEDAYCWACQASLAGYDDPDDHTCAENDPDPTEPANVDVTDPVDECECPACPDCDEDEDCECVECECDIDDPYNEATTEPNGDETTDPNGEVTTAVDGTTEAGTTTTTTTAVDPFLPPANLNTLPAAQQLEYFNLVMNRVRTERPAFNQRSRMRITNLSATGLATIAMPIVNPIMRQLMPGDWETHTVASGANNIDRFFANVSQPSMLRPQDISSITSTRQGNNWVITVRVREETNPTPGNASANGRLHQIMSRQEVLNEITDISSAIQADVNDATLRYHSGFATITVNAQGQITQADGGFEVDARANNVNLGPLTSNITAPQHTEHEWRNFRW